ncbi:MAG: TatD family hydrolase [Candidatus Paceibacterota bacterium]|jgi:TatD DNase family protein
MANEIKYFDIHSHLNFPEYETDRDSVLADTQRKGVAMITVGTDVSSSESAVDLASKTENMWATVGIHPTETSSVSMDNSDIFNAIRFDKSFARLTELARNPKVVAIGECGLDYFRCGPEDRVLQKELFFRHIEPANEVRKPLMLHVRSGKDTNAYQEAIQILKEKSKVRANFHFFAGNKEDLADIMAIGGTVSFTGVITFTHDYDDIVRCVPEDRIMSETDSPFVAPVPYRGKRNEPGHVTEVVKAIARIRGEDEALIATRLLRNARDFFIKN